MVSYKKDAVTPIEFLNVTVPREVLFDITRLLPDENDEDYFERALSFSTKVTLTCRRIPLIEYNVVEGLPDPMVYLNELPEQQKEIEEEYEAEKIEFHFSKLSVTSQYPMFMEVTTNDGACYANGLSTFFQSWFRRRLFLQETM